MDRVRANFDCIAALLRISFGNNFVRDCAYEVIVDVKNGNMQSSSEIINLVSDCQGPFISQEAVSNFRTIGLKIATMKNENQIHLSLQQLERASQESIYNKIIYYWISIDTLLPKIRDAIYISFREIYSQEEKNEPGYILNILGIKLAKDARNFFQHDGLKYAISELQERYMHMLFQDLLTYKLDLPSKKYLSNFIINSSFDINSFKEEQLKIATVIL